MHTSLDENTFYLNQYLHKQDVLEEEFAMSISDKQEAVVNLAKNILKQEVDQYTFELAFGKDYIYVSDDAYDFLLTTLEDMEAGVKVERSVKRRMAELALEAAAFALYHTELVDICSEEVCINQMINDVLDKLQVKIK